MSARPLDKMKSANDKMPEAYTPRDLGSNEPMIQRETKESMCSSVSCAACSLQPARL